VLALPAIRKNAGWRRKLAVVIIILFSCAFVFECMQETGLLDIKPEVEHHVPNVNYNLD